MIPNAEILINQTAYAQKYAAIIVKYHDGKTKTFTPLDFATFEKGLRKVAKDINFVPLKVQELSNWQKIKIFFKKVFLIKTK